MQYECMDKRFLLCKLTSVLDCIMKGKIIVSKFWTNFVGSKSGGDNYFSIHIDYR